MPVHSLVVFLYERNMFLFLLVFSLVLGVLLGFCFGRIRRLLFAVSTFLVVFFLIGYVWSRFAGRTITLQEMLSTWYTLRLFPWPVLVFQFLVAVALGLLVVLRRGFYPLGRFCTVLFLSLQLVYLLVWLGRWVDVLRPLERAPLEFFLWGILLLSVLSLAWKRMVVLVSSFLASALFMVAYLLVLEWGNWLNLFWGSTPFLAFLFLGLAVVMFSAEERA
ncbi:MAG: hypothetical protein PWP60_758 [Candidatus Atribacteria bacterium]|nr:hypothetical protein [Candidatus Atribacteria bacterium]MDI3530909.1 hypothetical protein [Candidatus Atribacteria bacterium]